MTTKATLSTTADLSASQTAGAASNFRAADTSGVAVPVGSVGEVKTATLTDTPLPNNTITNVGSLTLPAGSWMVIGKGMWNASNGTIPTAFVVSVSTSSGTLNAKSRMQIPALTGVTQDLYVTTTPIVINTTGQTVYMTALGSWSSVTTTPQVLASLSEFYAIRIA